jgi:hypothetical protein
MRPALLIAGRIGRGLARWFLAPRRCRMVRCDDQLVAHAGDPGGIPDGLLGLTRLGKRAHGSAQDQFVAVDVCFDRPPVKGGVAPQGGGDGLVRRRRFRMVENDLIGDRGDASHVRYRPRRRIALVMRRNAAREGDHVIAHVDADRVAGHVDRPTEHVVCAFGEVGVGVAAWVPDCHLIGDCRDTANSHCQPVCRQLLCQIRHLARQRHRPIAC